VSIVPADPSDEVRHGLGDDGVESESLENAPQEERGPATCETRQKTPAPFREFRYPRGVAPVAAALGVTFVVLAVLSGVRGLDVGSVLLMLAGAPLLALGYSHSRRIGVDDEAVYEKRPFQSWKRIAFADITRARYRYPFGKWVLHGAGRRIVCPSGLGASEEMMEMLCAHVPEQAFYPSDQGEGWVLRTCAVEYGLRVGVAAIGCVVFCAIALHRILIGAHGMDDATVILVLLSVGMLSAFILQLLFVPVRYVFGKEEIRVITALKRRRIPVKAVHLLSIEMRRATHSSYRALMVRFFPMSGEKRLELAEHRVNLPLHLILRKLREEYRRN
jgi:hypothetical protein